MHGGCRKPRGQRCSGRLFQHSGPNQEPVGRSDHDGPNDDENGGFVHRRSAPLIDAGLIADVIAVVMRLVVVCPVAGGGGVTLAEMVGPE